MSISLSLVGATDVDTGRDDDDVPGCIIGLVVGSCGCSSERVLSLRNSTRRGGADRRRRLFVARARQPRIHVGRQFARNPSVPPATPRQPVLRVYHPTSGRTFPPALYRHVITSRASSSLSSSKSIQKSTVRQEWQLPCEHSAPVGYSFNTRGRTCEEE